MGSIPRTKLLEPDDDLSFITPPATRKRRFLYESILPTIGIGTLPKTRISPRILSEIGRIRVLWAQGYTDSEIRKKMKITYAQWEQRISILPLVPADQDAIVNFDRHAKEHEKFIARSEARMLRLNELYKKARNKDLDTANTALAHLTTLDKEILRASRDLIDLKQKMGIIAEPAKRVELDGVLAVGTIEEVWRTRLKSRFKAKPIAAPPPEIEEFENAELMDVPEHD